METKKPTEHNAETVWYKCPGGCPALFLTQKDLDAHIKAFGKTPHADSFHRLHAKLEEWDEEDPQKEVKEEGEWRPSKNNKAGVIPTEFCLAEKQSFIVKAVLQQSDGTRWTPVGPYEYRLSFRDGKPLWITKRVLTTR
ncbi:Uncharacterised protein [uncultured archaeon]|nr:Uncharacterised protein [uncultured archaeon]